MMLDYDQLKERFIKWANYCEDIRAVIQVGSRAREDHPGDKWADIDFMIFSKNSDYYKSNPEWINNIAAPLYVISHAIIKGKPIYRAIFENGLALDFVFQPDTKLVEFQEKGSLPNLYNMGSIILLDKDSILKSIFPKTFLPPKYGKITEEKFIAELTFFWWANLYTAKQIMRNHFWVIKDCENIYWDKFLSLIELHTHATKSWDVKTWHTGRFIEEWGDKRILDSIPKILSNYEVDDFWRALFERMKLLRWVGEEIAESMGYKYPVLIDGKNTEIIDKMYNEFKCN